MSDFEEQARTLADDTLDRLAFRLNKIWRQWGPKDFPEDNGVAFRNEVFLRADWMLYLFRQACSEDPEIANEWLEQNATRFLNLNSEEFMRCIGVCSIHMQAFWWHFHFLHNPGSLYDEESTKNKLIRFNKQLDWIYIAHDLPEEASRTWYGLLVKHMGESGFVEASKEQIGRYLSKTPLGWSEASSPDHWDHWVCTASMTADSHLQHEPEKTKTLQYCEQVFSDF